MAKKCVIYLRVSTAEQAAPGHHSLDAQQNLCTRYAAANGFAVVEVLRDEGFSGRTTNRPGMRRLTEYASPNPPAVISAMLVQDTSRVGRNVTEYLLFRQQLQNRDIELIAVTQPNIDSSPEGRLVDTILAGVNQFASEEKGRRVSIAMQKKFDEGWWPGWAPLGYLNAEKDGRRFVESDPQRFPLIQLAFEEYASGRHTQPSLLEWLAKQGLTDRRNQPISRTTLNQMLRNPFYFGLMEWKGRKRTGLHDAAVDRATWEKCQLVTERNGGYAPRVRRHSFLLSGLTRCAECRNHHTHTVVSRKGNRYYHCKSSAGCSQPYIPEHTLDEDVAVLMESVRLSDDFISRVLEKIRERFQSQRDLEQQKANVLRRRKAGLEHQRDVAEEKLIAGVLSDEAYHRQISRIATALDDVESRLRELEGMHRFDADALRKVLQFARDISKAYRDAPERLKVQYIRFFFKEFIVKDRQIVHARRTPLLESLIELQQVRISDNWCPSLDVIRTLYMALLSSEVAKYEH